MIFIPKPTPKKFLELARAHRELVELLQYDPVLWISPQNAQVKKGFLSIDWSPDHDEAVQKFFEELNF